MRVLSGNKSEKLACLNSLEKSFKRLSQPLVYNFCTRSRTDIFYACHIESDLNLTKDPVSLTKFLVLNARGKNCTKPNSYLSAVVKYLKIERRKVGKKEGRKRGGREERKKKGGKERGRMREKCE